ncbi:cytochrome P450 [Dipodascopsis tothii]|uniref:cytochrome P450 n=1 Tax=Dipodascopsis tothii TaxID=44089 RepID=UPI0034CD9B8B
MLFHWTSTHAAVATAAVHHFVRPLSIGRAAVVFCALFAVLGALKVAYWTFIYPDYASPYRHLPTPERRTKVLGAYASFLIDRDYDASPRHALANPQVPFVRFPGPFGMDSIVPTSTAVMTEILASQVYKFAKPGFVVRSMTAILGNGVIFAEGEEHRRQRKLVAPALSLAQVRGMVPIMVRHYEHARSIIDGSGPPGQTLSVDVTPLVARLALDIVGEASFGVDMHALDDPDNEIVAAYHALCDPSDMPLAVALNAFVPGFSKLPVAANRRTARHRQTLHRFCAGVVTAKRAEFARERAEADARGSLLEKLKSSPDVLSYFVRDSSYDWTVDEIVEQMLVFLVAGHETTATALTWAFLQMCERPDLQARVHAEVREHLPDGMAGLTSLDVLDKLVLVDHLVLELLRLMPPVVTTPREATVDTVVHGVKIHKGTIVSVNPPQFNRSKELWGDDADEFNPDRWTDRRPENAYAYMTFLNGHRICIGKRFAEVELRVLLAGFLGRYRLEYSSENQRLHTVPTDVVITRRPSENVFVKFTAVDDWA